MSVKSMIDHEYELLSMTESELDQLTMTAPMTVRILERDIHMLQALAGIFGKSRSAFGAQLLEQSIAEAFSYLPAEDRLKAAEVADSAFQGSKGHWSNQAEAIELRDQARASREQGVAA
jgi:hypothetical protein